MQNQLLVDSYSSPVAENDDFDALLDDPSDTNQNFEIVAAPDNASDHLNVPKNTNGLGLMNEFLA